MKRHPYLSEQKPQHLNEATARKLNRFIVNDHFTKLKEVLTAMDILKKPERIFNADGKGIRMCLHSLKKVVAERGAIGESIFEHQSTERMSLRWLASVRLGILFLLWYYAKAKDVNPSGKITYHRALS